ncbi:MAG TPA: GNAT family N-acetyltransferase [Thermoanaerobaculia bacterium]
MDAWRAEPRPVEPADHAEWVRMRAALHGESDDHARETREIIAGDRGAYGVFVVPRPGGGLCGYIEVGERPYADCCDSSPVGYIESWWVDEDVRRMGVGAALVRVAEDWARARGRTEMGSDALLDNLLSHSAHRALGYAEVERLVIFRKDL